MPKPPVPPADPEPGPAIEPGAAEQLSGLLAPEPLAADAAARVRRRLLQRIAEAESGRHLSVPADQGEWQLLGPGLALKPLHRSAGLMSYLVRMAPGSRLPPHRHPVDEECLVLEGEVRVGSVRLGPGGFHLGRQGVPHAPIESPGGALIFLRGAVPDAALLL